MSHLSAHIVVTCPLAQARPRLRAFFRNSGNRAGDSARFSLAIDVEVPGLPIPLKLQRSIIATIQPYHVADDIEPRYSVQWAPERSGPFPLFAGELTIESTGDYRSFIIRVRGAYTPPLGVFGKGFDAAIGSRVAQAAAHELLRRMRDAIEGDYSTDESQKRPAIERHDFLM